MTGKRALVVTVILFQGLLLQGCVSLLAGAAVGAGSVAYYQGSLQATHDVSMDQAWQATERAVSDLEFEVTESRKDAVSGKLVAETAQDDTVKIYLNSSEQNYIKFEIRVNVFGDEELSRRVYQRIKSHLNP